MLWIDEAMTYHLIRGAARLMSTDVELPHQDDVDVILPRDPEKWITGFKEDNDLKFFVRSTDNPSEAWLILTACPGISSLDNEVKSEQGVLAFRLNNEILTELRDMLNFAIAATKPINQD